MMVMTLAPDDRSYRDFSRLKSSCALPFCTSATRAASAAVVRELMMRENARSDTASCFASTPAYRDEEEEEEEDEEEDDDTDEEDDARNEAEEMMLPVGMRATGALTASQMPIDSNAAWSCIVYSDQSSFLPEKRGKRIKPSDEEGADMMGGEEKSCGEGGERSVK